MASSAHNNDHPSRQQQEAKQHGPHHQFSSSGMMMMMMQPLHPSSSSSPSLHPKLICAKDDRGGAAYGLGELDEALFLYLNRQPQHEVAEVHHQKQKQQQQQLELEHHHHSIIDLQQQITHDGGMRPTLNIFPSQPMHVEPPSATNQVNNKSNETDPRGLVVVVSGAAQQGQVVSGGSSSKMVSAAEPISTDILPNSTLILSNTNQGKRTSSNSKRGPASSSELQITRSQTRDAKTLRRLAQNREAARKSRLRKKAYVQQLESSRIRLAQLEQEIQRARSQGAHFGGGLILGAEQHLGLSGGINNFTTDAAIFDMEYARWLEEHHRLMCELRAAIEEHLSENELQIYVDNCLAHFDEIMNIKSIMAKTDVFHLISGSWKSPAERCFMWIGGFRPSQIIKVVMSKIEGLTDEQAVGICGLQRSMEQAEAALSHGLEELNQSLSDAIVYDSLTSPPRDMTNYMGQMAMAASKLSVLEGFVRQADNLRYQAIHRLHQILMTRQTARGLLLIAEYFHRLRALSSLWLARPPLE
uniref:BZIP transcription factor n=1 Tax=Kalanchoe fedtschenkoi TaxID=63787 RepID=A0A7N0RIX1_KALFE